MIVGSLKLKGYIFQPNEIILYSIHLFLHIPTIFQQFSSNIEICQLVQICQLAYPTSWQIVIHMLAGWQNNSSILHSWQQICISNRQQDLYSHGGLLMCVGECVPLSNNRLIIAHIPYHLLNTSYTVKCGSLILYIFICLSFCSYSCYYDTTDCGLIVI